MVRIFILLEDVITNTLFHLKLRSLILEESELQSLKDLVEALKPIEKATRKLCSRKTTLGKADKILEIMLAKMYKLTSPIGRQLYASVVKRAKERRNMNMATLQAFLEDHEFLEEIEQADMLILEYTERSELIKSACYLYKRLFVSEDSENSDTVNMEVDNNPDNPSKYHGLTLSASDVLAMPMSHVMIFSSSSSTGTILIK